MTDLPPLDQAVTVCIFLEGGVAYLPALSRSRPIDLAGCDDALRDQVRRIVSESARRAQDAAGDGDRRYFRIEVTYGDALAGRIVDFKVPEEQAPEILRELWMRQRD